VQNSVTGKHEVHGEFFFTFLSICMYVFLRVHVRDAQRTTLQLLCSLQVWSRGELAAVEKATLAFTQEFLNTWTGSRGKCPTPAPVTDAKNAIIKHCQKHLIY
jgi:hypothetical protein